MIKKIISVISRVWLSLFIGGVSFAILRGIAYQILHYMQSTGGVMLASDYVAANFIPAILSIVLTGFVWHSSKGLND